MTNALTRLVTVMLAVAALMLSAAESPVPTPTTDDGSEPNLDLSATMGASLPVVETTAPRSSDADDFFDNFDQIYECKFDEGEEESVMNPETSLEYKCGNWKAEIGNSN